MWRFERQLLSSWPSTSPSSPIPKRGVERLWLLGTRLFIEVIIFMILFSVEILFVSWSNCFNQFSKYPILICFIPRFTSWNWSWFRTSLRLGKPWMYCLAKMPKLRTLSPVSLSQKWDVPSSHAANWSFWLSSKRQKRLHLPSSLSEMDTAVLRTLRLLQSSGL